MRANSILTAVGLLLGLAATARAEDPASQPKPVPVTRTDMKKALDDLKKREPRLPMAALTDEEKDKAGGRTVVGNGRMRALYLEPELRGESARDPDPNMTLERPYKVMFFWIVSRGNNCHYCLGHQEAGLAAAGLSDDKIAALDGDWSEFTDAERAAFTLVRKMTYEPHKIKPLDLDPVRKHYKDLQVLEIVLTVAGNNATNRWTDSLGIPQEASRVFLTPTSDKYKDAATQIALLDPNRPAGKCVAALPVKRPALESRDEVEKALAACRKRTPVLPLVDEAKAKEALGDDAPKGTLPQWERLLANFPKQGVGRIKTTRAAETAGLLDKKLRAEVAWIAAREDRAWYAVGRAKLRLKAAGLSDDEVYALDGVWDKFAPAERAAFAFVRKLTTTPQLIVDEDIAGLRKHFKDKEVAELVHQVTVAAFFDRLTETANLQLEE